MLEPERTAFERERGGSSSSSGVPGMLDLRSEEVDEAAVKVAVQVELLRKASISEWTIEGTMRLEPSLL
jgi:hypothetical protein